MAEDGAVLVLLFPLKHHVEFVSVALQEMWVLQREEFAVNRRMRAEMDLPKVKEEDSLQGYFDDAGRK